jgi:hypothetical protein
VFRSIDKWLLGYLRSLRRRPPDGPAHILFCVADHFEPFKDLKGRPEDARLLVKDWVLQYSASVDGIHDDDGRPPVHTIFYPEEEYDRGCLSILEQLCANALAEVELHLHHRNDTAEGLAEKLAGFRDRLHNDHGLLGCDADGNVRYGFVHGNWSLCNSRPDGDWCGVNEELGILRSTGCYADFTFPSAPSPTQPRTVNAVYRAVDTPGRPRAHDTGIPVACGRSPCRDSLMLIQGPLGLNWRRRKWGIFPRLENAELSAANPPTPERADLWVAQGIHVAGSPDWVFVKVHTHGCVAGNRAALAGDEMRRTREHLARRYGGGECRLHYVSAREMYNIARAAEDGKSGNANDYRDYEISSSISRICSLRRGR